MKRPLKIVLAVLVALILGGGIGVGSAIAAYENLMSAQSVTNGVWQTNLDVGSSEANPYVRAWVAVHGLLALNQSETIYCNAYTDESGKPFDGDSVYRIEGKAPDARWWSITVYGEDDFLIPNPLNRYSYSGNTVTYDKDGKFTIYLSRSEKPGDWIPLGDQKKFNMSLRLYNPGESIRKNFAVCDLPRVIREESK